MCFICRCKETTSLYEFNNFVLPFSQWSKKPFKLSKMETVTESGKFSDNLEISQSLRLPNGCPFFQVLQEFNKNIFKSKYLNDTVARTAKPPSR